MALKFRGYSKITKYKALGGVINFIAKKDLHKVINTAIQLGGCILYHPTLGYLSLSIRMEFTMKKDDHVVYFVIRT
jgi:hypothetical protein